MIRQRDSVSSGQEDEEPEVKGESKARRKKGLSPLLEHRLQNEEGYSWVIGVDEAGRGPLIGPVVVAACLVPLDVSLSGIRDSKAIQTEDQREAVYEQLVATPGVIYAVCQRSAEAIDDHNILSATTDGMASAAFEVMRQCAMLGVAKATDLGQEKRATIRWGSTAKGRLVEDVESSEENPFSPRHRGLLPSSSCDLDSLPRHLPQGRIKVLVDGNRMPPRLAQAAKGGKVVVETVVKGDATVFSIACASVIAKVTRDRIMHELDKKYPNYNLKIHKGYPTSVHMELIKQHGITPHHRLTFNPIKSWLLNAELTLPYGRKMPEPPQLKASNKRRSAAPPKGQLSIASMFAKKTKRTRPEEDTQCCNDAKEGPKKESESPRTKRARISEPQSVANTRKRVRSNEEKSPKE